MGNTLTALAILNGALGNTLTVPATFFLSPNNSSVWLSPSALSAYIALSALLFTLLNGFAFKYITKPKLRASMTNEAPDSHNIITTLRSIPYDSRYFRVNITNVGVLSNIIIKRPAKNVEVYGLSLFKACDKWFDKVEDFLPRNFTWAHMEKGKNIYAQRITHLNSKHCDIFYVVKDNQYILDMSSDVFTVKGINKTALPAILLTNVNPNHFDWILGPGTYLIQISISSDESRPKYYEIKITHKGTWNEQKDRPDTNIDYCKEINPKRMVANRIRPLS